MMLFIYFNKEVDLESTNLLVKAGPKKKIKQDLTNNPDLDAENVVIKREHRVSSEKTWKITNCC